MGVNQPQSERGKWVIRCRKCGAQNVVAVILQMI